MLPSFALVMVTLRSMCVCMQGCTRRPSGHISRAWQLGTLPLSIISLCDLCLLLSHYICSKSWYQFALYFTVKAVTCILLKKILLPGSLFAAPTFQREARWLHLLLSAFTQVVGCRLIDRVNFRDNFRPLFFFS